MVKRSFDLEVEGQASGSPVFNNPTFSREDSDRGEAEVTKDAACHVAVQPENVKEMSKFKPITLEPGDHLKLAFLVGFPLVFFIVAVIVTGSYV